MYRTPPGTTGQNESTFPCQVCTISDDKSMICCNHCNSWFHSACVNEPENVHNQEWFCASCVTTSATTKQQISDICDLANVNLNAPAQSTASEIAKLSQVQSAATETAKLSCQDQSQRMLVDTTSQTAINRTNQPRKSKSSSTSSTVKKRLALQRLEEERQFELQEQARREKSEREYLDKKYAILEDLESNATEGEFNITEEELYPFQNSRVERWVTEAKELTTAMEMFGYANTLNQILDSVTQSDEVAEKVDNNGVPDNPKKNDQRRPLTESLSAADQNGKMPTNDRLGYQNDDPTTKGQENPTVNRELTATAPGARKLQTTSHDSIQTQIENPNMRPSNVMQREELRRKAQEISQRLADVNQIRTQYGFPPMQVAEILGHIGQRQPDEQFNGTQEFHRQQRCEDRVPAFTEPSIQQQNGSIQQAEKIQSHRNRTDNQPHSVNEQMFAQRNQIMPNSYVHTAAIQATSLATIERRPVMSTSVYQSNSRPQPPNILQYDYPPVSSCYYRDPITSDNNCQPIYSSHNQQLFNHEIERQDNRNPSYVRDPTMSRAHSPNPTVLNDDQNVRVIGMDGQGDTMTIANIMSRQVVDRTLQVFTGNPLEWNAWYNRYESTTNKCKLDNSENLSRLVKCLKGKAEKLVKSKLGQTEAVPWIMQTLKKVFGRPEIILKAALDQVSKIPALKGDDLVSIMEFALEARSIRTAIDAPGMPNDYANPLILKDLVAKLPAQLQLEWARDSRRISQVTVRSFTDWLDVLADDISTVVEPSIDPPTKKKPEKASESNKAYVNVHVESGHNSKQSNNMTESKENKKSSACITCGKGCSKLENCSVFTSMPLDKKWNEIKEQKLCRTCLKKHKPPCKLTNVCGKNGCLVKHHPLLHNDATNTSNKDQKVATSNVHQVTSEQVMLKYVPVILHKDGKQISTFAFFDDGTQVSMIEQQLADKLGIQGTKEELCLLWTKDIHRKENAQRISIEVSSEENSNHRFTLKGIRAVQNLHLPAQTFVKKEFVKSYPYLVDVPIREYKDAIPGIILGSDFPKLGVQLKTIEGKEFIGPIAQKTRLGWTIYGPTSGDSSVKYANNHHVIQVCPHHNQTDQNIHQQIKEHFSIENFGVQANNAIDMESKDNKRAIEMLQQLTKKVGDKYETGLLWKRDDINKNLPDSYPMAMKRLISLEKQGDEMVKRIGDKIQEYVDKGYVRKLSESEVKELGNNVWYLPVFGVIHPKKPDKLRMVFDGAAKVKSVSLNSMLLIGPDELASLIDILRRFREKLFGVGGDIKEMYHQVKIIQEDQNFQLFLFRNGETNRKPDVYIIEVMTFGSKCSPAAAQFVKNTNAKQYEKTNPRAVESIIINHYVDDMMDGENTIEDTIQMVEDVKRIHANGGFEIRNFISNSPEVLKAIGCTEGQENKELSLNSELKTERVLGMWWNTKLDSFTFSLKYTAIAEPILNGTKLPTKRELLQTLMSIFDPLGLLSNYMIQLKILLQDIWRMDHDWDEQISATGLVEKWKQWLKYLPSVESVQIPRLYSLRLISNVPKSIEIHTFVDASTDAFAAVTYLRVITEDGVDCALMGSKARVAPLKYLSIPRKELQAGILGSRLTASIANAQRFKVDRRIFWSDSETVLSWLKSDNKKYSQFVAHRVGEILENTDVNEWRWVSSKENVADEATKWAKSGVNFESSNRWFSGPKFLHTTENNWPKKREIKPNVQEEMKSHCVHTSLVLPQLFDSRRFSKWNRMLRAVAYSIRFRNTFHDKNLKGKPLSQEEFADAERHIFRQAQFEGFPSEMVTLIRNESLPLNKRKFIEKPSQLYDGSPYLDGIGIMRMRGRIDGARDLSIDAKRPIILPKDSRITRLLVQDYHTKFYHQNHNTVINEIKQRFYIPKLRVLLKSVRNECQMCKVRLAKIMEPQMADLPQARTATFIKPFSYVGVDYFGPMTVKIGRRKEKRWGVLFTCLTVRAVHIEIAASLSADSCIKAIRNFISDRGEVIEFHSDCGTNFTGAVSELEREMSKLNWDELQIEFTSSFTKWNFNPPAAPHMGGSWERLISSVKCGLYSALLTCNPTEETLRNILKEIQNVVNSRPLTFVPLEIEEDEALTPNHFLHENRQG